MTPLAILKRPSTGQGWPKGKVPQAGLVLTIGVGS